MKAIGGQGIEEVGNLVEGQAGLGAEGRRGGGRGEGRHGGGAELEKGVRLFFSGHERTNGGKQRVRTVRTVAKGMFFMPPFCIFVVFIGF